ncbi:MAG: flagellar basal body P-ring formation chaperone FlgA [Abditibacteriales bacterium]|nr:flagellar basal body P-ring formation chaperone FlgA [Abditibacteriales bacterium]MDW8364572.1 flagellar basal body P-ring formation chaperone FlgA [Abditibacteriales bacterium]
MKSIRNLTVCAAWLAWALGRGAVAQEESKAQATITIAERSEVQGRTIRLGDVARIATEDKELADRLSALEIQTAPLPGQTLTVDPNFIRTRLRQARIDLSQIQLTVPPKILVVSRATIVPRTMIIEEAKRLILSQPMWAGKDVTIDDPPFVDDVVVPPGQVELKAQRIGAGNSLSSSLVAVSVCVDGRTVRTLNLFLKIHVYADVVVAARTLSRREVIAESDVQTERRDLSSLPPDVCLDAKDVIGKRLTRVAVKGQALNRAMLEIAPDVTAGSRVIVRASIGQVKITLLAEAREDGWIGKTILVRNVDSNKTFRATVVDVGVVEVKPQ